MPRTCHLRRESGARLLRGQADHQADPPIADVVNADPADARWLRVVFLPDYRVTLAEAIMPAADLSEQISTAGTEASGTGNMKFALNGALTIGTLDGANIEIAQAVGAENIFIFGLKVDDVQRQLAEQSYRPALIYEADARVRRVIDSLESGILAPDDPGVFRPIRETLLSDNEHYFHLADLVAYRDRQQDAATLWTDRRAWARKALLTVARMSRFSSDRTVREYAEDIWKIKPVPLNLGRLPRRSAIGLAREGGEFGARSWLESQSSVVNLHSSLRR